MRRNKFDRKPQANHRNKRQMDSFDRRAPTDTTDAYPPFREPAGDAVPKHRHRFESYTLEKNERGGMKIQIVECVVPGCGLKFVRDKAFKVEEPVVDR
jgi:hypothetical protein